MAALTIDEHGHHHGEDPASRQAAERQQRAAGKLRLRRQQGGGQHGTGQCQQRAENRYSGPPMMMAGKLISSRNTILGTMLNWHRVMNTPVCTASSASSTRLNWLRCPLLRQRAIRRMRWG